MRGPFEYSLRIAWFLFIKWLFFGVFRNLTKKQPFAKQNSKVCEQKGDLLNFKANIDPVTVLSRVKPGWAESSWVELSWAQHKRCKLITICHNKMTQRDSARLSATQRNSARLRVTQHDSTQLSTTQHDSMRLSATQLESARLSSTQLNSAWLSSTQLDPAWPSLK